MKMITTMLTMTTEEDDDADDDDNDDDGDDDDAIMMMAPSLARTMAMIMMTRSRASTMRAPVAHGAPLSCVARVRMSSASYTVLFMSLYRALRLYSVLCSCIPFLYKFCLGCAYIFVFSIRTVKLRTHSIK